MLQLENISKTYSDGTRALKGVSLEFGRGMVGLLGPNGAGKTTLLSILTLAQEPSGGRRIYFGLEDRPRHRPSIRNMIGYLPQEFEPMAELSGIEYLEMCARWRRVPLRGRRLRARIDRLLEAVELTSAARRRADSYSGGMIRRLGLAQAILHSPRFLVVDEPTAGLDPEERIRFRNLITDLADEIPVLLSTHIVEDIEATCPRLAIIAAGRLLFDGAPGELMRWAEGRLWRHDSEEAEVPAGGSEDPEESAGQPAQEPAAGEAAAGVEGSGDGAATNPWLKVGRRVDAEGRGFQVVYGEEAPPQAVSLLPTLEEACSAFLAREAHQSLDAAP